MNMLSEALYIMDRNMERLMVEELQEAVAVAKEEARQAVAAAQAAAKKETTILRLRLAGKSPEEIAEELSISLEEVNKVLAP